MIRWLAVASVFLLSGCVTTREIVYRDVYPDGNTVERRYVDRSDYYYDDGTTYVPSSGSAGDYYYRDAGYGYGDSTWNVSASYVDYPYYYSVFWPLYRSWYDPYWHPGYYYGVTYFPRDYFSINIGYRPWYGWSGWGSWYYSPYRYSWVDNYYDWRPWYHHNRRHHERWSAPRYGSARNEAERLSRRSDYGRYPRRQDESDYALRPRSDAVRRTPYGTYGTTRDPSRDADYGGRTAPRMDPGTRGFGVPVDGEVRRSAQGAGSRTLPSQRGFGVESERSGTASGYRRDGDRGAQQEVGRVGSARGMVRGEATSRELPARGNYVAPYGTREEGIALPRGGSSAPRSRDYEVGSPSYRPVQRGAVTAPSRSEPVVREYPRGSAGSGDYAAPVRRETREYSPRSQPRYDAAPAYSAPEPRSYQAPPAPRSYEAPARSYEAPARTYEAPARSYEAPARSYEAPARDSGARYESRGGGSSDSGRSDGGGARRVGSRRDD